MNTCYNTAKWGKVYDQHLGQKVGLPFIVSNSVFREKKTVGGGVTGKRKAIKYGGNEFYSCNTREVPTIINKYGAIFVPASKKSWESAASNCERN